MPKPGYITSLPELKDAIDKCLGSSREAVIAEQEASRLLQRYRNVFTAEDKKAFLTLLGSSYGIAPAPLKEAASSILNSLEEPPSPERPQALKTMRKILTSPRMQLIRLFYSKPDGLSALITMRGDLLELIRNTPCTAAKQELHELDVEFRELLDKWVHVGNIELHKVTWERSPAALIESISLNDEVQRMQSIEDVKERISGNKAIYCFNHDAICSDPIIFIEVALLPKIPTSKSEILGKKATSVSAANASTAVFYSINSVPPGLSGLSFGNYLIKRVATDIKQNHQHINTFVTLSPIPGFSTWLLDVLDKGPSHPSFHNVESILATHHVSADIVRPTVSGDFRAREKAIRHSPQAVMLALCAHYLWKERSVSRPGGGNIPKALDGVAHFHLSNGAMIEQINWMADMSEARVLQSAGMMVNYIYDHAFIEDNHQAYTGEGTIEASRTVSGYLKAPKAPRRLRSTVKCVTPAPTPTPGGGE